MPCRDDGPHTTQQDIDFPIVKELACTYCKFLDSGNTTIPEWAIEWWMRHKEEDRKSTQAEEQKQDNLNLVASIRGKLKPNEIDYLRTHDFH